MATNFKPEAGFRTYEDYVSWYLRTFDGTSHMLNRAKWEARFGKLAA